MITVVVLFGLLTVVVLGLVVVLLRRGNSRTENAEGLLIERTRRIQAREDRASYSSIAMHNTTPTMSDQYRH